MTNEEIFQTAEELFGDEVSETLPLLTPLLQTEQKPDVKPFVYEQAPATTPSRRREIMLEAVACYIDHNYGYGGDARNLVADIANGLVPYLTITF